MRVPIEEIETAAAPLDREPRRFEFVTFDCYGTLIDWEQGIGDAFVEAAAADGLTLDPARVVELYHALEPDVEDEVYRPYRDVLEETARRVASKLDWEPSAAREGFLAESLPRWPAFADTHAALSRLRASGHRLGVLSNVDNDLLQATLRKFPVRFELLVTAEQVEAYKPSPAHFVAAGNRIGDAKWLHAAQSWFHDVEPACEMDIPVAWVNRKEEPAGGTATPRFVLRTLAELAERLDQRRGG